MRMQTPGGQAIVSMCSAQNRADLLHRYMTALHATADLTKQPIKDQNDKDEVNEQRFYFKEHFADSYCLLECSVHMGA